MRTHLKSAASRALSAGRRRRQPVKASEVGPTPRRRETVVEFGVAWHHPQPVVEGSNAERHCERHCRPRSCTQLTQLPQLPPTQQQLPSPCSCWVGGSSAVAGDRPRQGALRPQERQGQLLADGRAGAAGAAANLAPSPRRVPAARGTPAPVTLSPAPTPETAPLPGQLVVLRPHGAVLLQLQAGLR